LMRWSRNPTNTYHGDTEALRKNTEKNEEPVSPRRREDAEEARRKQGEIKNNTEAAEKRRRA
jgi:hypothetical protein